jgi:hypothetical protein
MLRCDKSPFYSKTLKSLNYDYPVEIGFYFTTIYGLNLMARQLWKAWNMKVEEAIKQKSENINVYLHRSGYANEKLLLGAMKSRNLIIASGIGSGLALIGRCLRSLCPVQK